MQHAAASSASLPAAHPDAHHATALASGICTLPLPRPLPFSRSEPEDGPIAARARLTASLLRNVSPSSLSIRLADTDGQRNEASVLVSKMYGWRGYKTDPTATSSRAVTLVAFVGQRLVGTLTVGFDSPAGLACGTLYPDQVVRLRDEGARLCEFTRLAVDGAEHSTELLAMMFHVAFIYARHLRGGTDLLIEVNPRHVAFYKRMLGFEQLGPERTCPRVNAPAVLLRLKLQHAEQQIARFGGHEGIAKGVRSLYPLCFRAEEVESIATRLRAIA